MGRDTGDRIVPFPGGPPPGRGARPGTGRPAAVYRPFASDDPDAKRNAAWDELLAVVDKAWTWRDPDTLNEIESCLLRLGLVVESEWT